VQAPRVVITGVAGFIGSNLAEYLLCRGYCVVGVDNLSQGVRSQVPAGVEFHEMDVRDPAFGGVLREGDVVFHLAAKNCIPDCQEDPVETVSSNVLGTVTVLEAASRRGVEKVIYAESSAVYEGTSALPTPEGAVAPESFYGISKYACHLLAAAYRRYRGLRLTGLRYFCVYGPRQDYRRTIPPVMSAFILALLMGKRPVIYGDGSKRRDFVHVDDVNRFHELCIVDRRTDGGVFNLGSGRSYSVLEILSLVAEVVGIEAVPEFRPDLPGEAQETLADISKARALGWEPQIDIRAGLQGMVDYIRREVLSR